VSLAPRFVGKFQKGVDYMGDRDLFSAELTQHVAIMNHFIYYKLSIHTGSDKFSIYPIIALQTQGRFHVKTAGTSYLEALRLIATGDPDLFRGIVGYACAHFAQDRKTYYLDAKIENVPAANNLPASELAALLDQFDTRQVLHVTFGSVLDRYGSAIRSYIDAHESAYISGLAQHFERHLSPFLRAAGHTPAQAV
jgi:tagaturonate epimerase